MKCYEMTGCSEQDRNACFVWTSLKNTPEEMNDIKCWVLKGAYHGENKILLENCRKCKYYLTMNRDTGIESETTADAAIISCEGSINNDRTRALDMVWENLKKNGKYNVILDLSQVNNIYSCGLGLLVKIHKETQSNQGTLVISGAQGYVLAIFTSTKLSRIIRMAPDKRTAIESFEQQRKKKEHAQKVAAEKAAAMAPKKRVPCWEYWNGHNPKNATGCDECFRKVSTSKNLAGLWKG